MFKIMENYPWSSLFFNKDFYWKLNTPKIFFKNFHHKRETVISWKKLFVEPLLL